MGTATGTFDEAAVARLGGAVWFRPVDLATAMLLTATWAVTARGVRYMIAVERSEWRLFDWLVSYEGGFVRRGLSGEIVLGFADLAGVAASTVVVAVQLVAYGVFFWAAFLLVRRLRPVPPPVWLLLFSPWLFTFQVHDPPGGARKDVLALALLAVAAAVIARMARQQIPWVVVAAIGLSVPLVLMHELAVLLVPYMLALGVLGDWSRRQLAAGGAALAGVAAAVGATLMYPGTAPQVASICREVAAVVATAPTVERCASEGAVAVLAWSTQDGVAHVAQQLPLAGPSLPVAVTLVGVGLAPTLWLVRRQATTGGWRALVTAMIVGWIATVPLFVVALDWGRFVYLQAVGAALVAVTMLARSPQPPRRSSVRRRHAVAAVAVGYALLWHLNHYQTLVAFDVGGGWVG